MLNSSWCGSSIENIYKNADCIACMYYKAVSRVPPFFFCQARYAIHACGTLLPHNWQIGRKSLSTVVLRIV